MPSLLTDPARLLDAWECGVGIPPVARGAAVVAAAGLVAGGSAVDLPLAECAALAIRAHLDAFGRSIACTATCDGCGELIELALDLADLAAADGVPAAVATVEVGGATLTVRALTTRDLVEAGSAAEPRAFLVDRCLTEVLPDEHGDGDDDPSAVVDVDVRAAVEQAAERLAGAAGIVVKAVCPACGAVVRVGLDPGQLLWERVATAAEGLVADVAALAAAYGWTEDDVLRLTPARRAAYLELAPR